MGNYSYAFNDFAKPLVHTFSREVCQPPKKQSSAFCYTIWQARVGNISLRDQDEGNSPFTKLGWSLGVPLVMALCESCGLIGEKAGLA